MRAMVYMGYESHQQWGLWAMGTQGAMGYRVHKQWDPQGQSGTGGVGTGGMGHMANKAHRGYGVQGVWGTWAIEHNDTFNLKHLSPHRAILHYSHLIWTSSYWDTHTGGWGGIHSYMSYSHWSRRSRDHLIGYLWCACDARTLIGQWGRSCAWSGRDSGMHHAEGARSST